MKTLHRIFYENSKELSQVPSASVELIVTSPPYPMIKMWDENYSKQNLKIKRALKSNNGSLAFELMHEELDKTWREVYRVLIDGGIVCINVGDATRTLNNNFQLFNNHTRIINQCLSVGFQTLPPIIWRKQTNAPNKFMGSGMLPPGAYVTLEHEYIIILRKKEKRIFKTIEEKNNRKESAFFWEERNLWFSDIWFDLKGTGQNLNYKESRNRSGAYPFELACRLINMFSVKGDTVLDPFLGTGTTTVAALSSERNSIGIEVDSHFSKIINERVLKSKTPINHYIQRRIIKHKDFIRDRELTKKSIKYLNKPHGFPVMTRQEVEAKIRLVDKIEQTAKNKYIVLYTEVLATGEKDSQLKIKFKN